MIRKWAILYVIFPTSIATFAGSCVNTQQANAPQLIAGDSTGGAIVTNAHMRPRPLAVNHCAKYGKQYYLKDLDRVGESIDVKYLRKQD